MGQRERGGEREETREGECEREGGTTERRREGTGVNDAPRSTPSKPHLVMNAWTFDARLARLVPESTSELKWMLPLHPPSEKTGLTPLAFAWLTKALMSDAGWSVGTVKPVALVTVTK